jgi:hypothetical protein
MQKKEYIWAEEEKHYEEERLDLAQQMKPWAYSYFPPGGRGTASLEWTMTLPQLGLQTCSYCREGSRDLVFPLERRCSDAIHLHRPWRQRLGGKTLDEMRKRKMMRRKKKLRKELGFFTFIKCALFISTP